MEQKIDKEVFDTFFRESYVPVDYATVREEFYEITADKEEVFSEELEDKPLTEKNFILYARVCSALLGLLGHLPADRGGGFDDGKQHQA